MQIFVALIKIVLTLLLQFRVGAVFSGTVLALFGLYGFIFSLSYVPQDAMIGLLLAIFSLLWVALWGYVMHLAITSPIWPLPKRAFRLWRSRW